MLDALLDSIIALTHENLTRACAAITAYESAMMGYFGKALMTFEIGDFAKDRA
jgi:hypothetical protein